MIKKVKKVKLIMMLKEIRVQLAIKVKKVKIRAIRDFSIKVELVKIKVF